MFPLVPLTLARVGRPSAIRVNLQRVLWIETVADMPMERRDFLAGSQTVGGDLATARSVLFMNVAGEALCVMETSDEIQEAYLGIARLAGGANRTGPLARAERLVSKAADEIRAHLGVGKA